MDGGRQGKTETEGNERVERMQARTDNGDKQIEKLWKQYRVNKRERERERGQDK